MAMKTVEFTVSKEKMHSKELEQLEALRKEIKILSGLKHPHVVRYIGMEEDNCSVSLFMEFMKGDSIYRLIQNQGPLKEDDASKYCQQILKGLAYLHDNNVVHRDIKCGNILLDNHNNCKLADFGISKHADNIKSMAGCDTTLGTPYWTSPEIILKLEYGWKTDIWSFGCTVLEMLTGEPPYRKMEPYAAWHKIGKEGVEDPCFPPDASEHVKEFVRQCLQKAPENRPSSKELLLHTFLELPHDAGCISILESQS